MKSKDIILLLAIIVGSLRIFGVLPEHLDDGYNGVGFGLGISWIILQLNKK